VSVPGSRYIDWVVPGLLGMNIMGTGMWSVAFSVVQARGRKLLKRLMATPMRRSHYLLSHMLSRLLFLVLEVTALLGFARLVFGIPVNGSWLTLAGFCLLGALTFSGIGLLVASRAKTVEGVSGLMNLVMVPMWIFSGVFFASENFPDAMQPLISLLPLTALNQALRGVMIDGAGIPALLPQATLLIVWTVVSFSLALKLFRWR
jgi:ABC-type multidrug transport system permease subunit